MKKIIYIYIIVMSAIAFGQKKDSIPNFDGDYFLDKKGDTLNIEIEEVTIFPRHKFKSRTDRNYYLWFKKKVYKAYPYAVLFSKRLDSLNNRLGKIKTKSKRRKYVKLVQNYVEEEFRGQLKKMTRTEGRILIGLIHRQTGKTAYQNIRQLRSGFKAFLYNAQASIFSISLKDEYEPFDENEDYLVEDVIQRAFIFDDLEYQEPKLKFDGELLVSSKKGKVDVEKYKKMFSKRKKK